jgi:membrane protease YdiL (CAAX protease family)
MGAIKTQLRLAGVWAAVGALSVVAAMPYVFTLQADLLSAAPFGWPVVVVLSTAQTGLLMFIGAIVGLTLGRSVGLDSPVARTWLDQRRFEISRRPAAISVALGVLSAGAIFGLDAAVFSALVPPVPAGVSTGLAWWKGLLASFYGGIGEELLLRLGVMTLLTWLVWRVVHRRAVPVPAFAFWFGIVGAALLFGAGHLPATAALWPLTGPVIARALVLNGIGGIAFGWLYWKHGLEHAMLAHFTADVVLHVLLVL